MLHLLDGWHLYSGDWQARVKVLKHLALLVRLLRVPQIVLYLCEALNRRLNYGQASSLIEMKTYIYTKYLHKDTLNKDTNHL